MCEGQFSGKDMRPFPATAICTAAEAKGKEYFFLSLSIYPTLDASVLMTEGGFISLLTFQK